jgi:hypothetical protein
LLKYHGSKRKFLVAMRDFLISRPRKKVAVAGRNSCHRKTIPATGRQFLSQEENFCHKKKIPVTFLREEEHFYE